MNEEKGEVVVVRRGGRVTIPKALLDKKKIKEKDHVLLLVNKVKFVDAEKGEKEK